MSRPVILEVALNGAAPKHANPRAPHGLDEVVDDAIACLDAGASIVHNHNTEPVLGSPPSHDPQPYIDAWRRVRARHPQAIFYPTMGGGGAHTTIEQRYSHIEAIARAGELDMGLVDPGTTNIGRFAADGAPRPDDWVYQNTYRDAVYQVETCRRLGVGMSVSIFEPGFVRFVQAYVEAGKLPRGALIKFYFGAPRAGFGLPPTRKALEAYLEMIDGTGLSWLVSVQGGDVLASGLAEHALELGGHLQIGLEPAMDPNRTNVEIVNEAAALVRRKGMHVATCAEAREIVGLPPRRGVAHEGSDPS
jgi:uncharacterized protein (DUF849 family)